MQVPDFIKNIVKNSEFLAPLHLKHLQIRSIDIECLLLGVQKLYRRRRKRLYMGSIDLEDLVSLTITSFGGAYEPKG